MYQTANAESVAIAGATENDPLDVITGREGQFSVGLVAAESGHAKGTIRAWCSRHNVPKDDDGAYVLSADHVALMCSQLGAPRRRP
jgi:hypothetical protein